MTTYTVCKMAKERGNGIWRFKNPEEVYFKCRSLAYSKRAKCKSEEGFHTVFMAIKKIESDGNQKVYANYYTNGIKLNEEQFQNFINEYNEVIARH